MKHTLALVVAFMALVGLVLLFAGSGKRGPPQQPSPLIASQTQAKSTGENNLPSLFSPFAAANDGGVAVSILDNDLDNDDDPDGLADPLIAVEVLSVLAALVGVKLLLVLCEAPKLSSTWLQVLERPG